MVSGQHYGQQASYAWPLFFFKTLSLSLFLFLIVFSFIHPLFPSFFILVVLPSANVRKRRLTLPELGALVAFTRRRAAGIGGRHGDATRERVSVFFLRRNENSARKEKRKGKSSKTFKKRVREQSTLWSLCVVCGGAKRRQKLIKGLPSFDASPISSFAKHFRTRTRPQK